MAISNTLNINNLGLININKKIIDSRAFLKSSITTLGNPLITDGIASGLSSDSYFTYNNLNFEETESIAISFEGAYLKGEGSQTAWVLSSSEDNLSLKFSNAGISFSSNDTEIFKYSSLNFDNEASIKAYLILRADSYEFTLYFGSNSVQRQGALDTSINISEFSRVTIGNDIENSDDFWMGSISLKNFAILKDNVLYYTPSLGHTFTFTKILVSDGEFPLTDTSTPLLNHIYSFDVEEANRSGNSVLLTSQVGSDAYLVIKEIGLYAKSPDGEFLFGILTNLNINKSADLVYDLIFSVDILLGFANITGIPDIIVNEPEYEPYKNFKTMKDVHIYVLTNLERLIKNNARALGYNKAQVFYRLQRDIERQEDCYNTLDTYASLSNTFGNKLLGFYHIPEYNRYRYYTSDLTNFDHNLLITGSSFYGNSDNADFNNLDGLTICTKVYIKNSYDKLLLAKSNLINKLYFTLEMQSQAIIFTLYLTDGSTIVLKKQLDLTSLKDFEEEPIMLTISMKRDYTSGIFTMYRNGNIINNNIRSIENLPIASEYSLSNYISSTENPQRYVSDIVIVGKDITPEELFIINNLFDTNF